MGGARFFACGHRTTWAGMRRRVAVVLLAGLVATACSGDSDEPDAGADGSTAVVADGAERTLTVALADDWAPAPAVVRATEDFEASHPGVTVDLVGAPFGQLKEAVIADREGAQDIDLAQWHAFAAGSQGFARPITQRFHAEFGEDTFIPGAVGDVSWGAEVYGVPLDVNAVVMLVNTTALDALGHTVDDFGDWQGVRTVAEAAAGASMGFTHLPASTWTTYAWVRANGADFMDVADDGTATLTFDDPAMVETFAFLAELAEGGRLAIPPDEVDSTSDGYALFLDGHILTYTTGSWDIARLLQDEPGFEWEVVAMPHGPRVDRARTVLGGSSLYVTEQADDPALAFEFAAHLIRPEYSLAYAMDDGRLPPQYQVLEDPFFEDPRYAAVVDELPQADPMRSIAFDRVEDLYGLAIFEILDGDATALDILGRLQAEAIVALDQDLADSPQPLSWAGPTE